MKEQTLTSQMVEKRKPVLIKPILDIGWHLLERFVYYKAHRAGKAIFKVSAHYNSQECSDCGYTHPDNRKTQELFNCRCCGYSDNADHNSAKVLKKRAIKLILDSGTELSERGVLLDKGRGAAHKTQEGTLFLRKQQRNVKKESEGGLSWKLIPFRCE